MPATTRHAARERAMSLLYEADSKGCRPAQVLEELPVAPDPFVVDLVRGVADERERIDELIAAHAIGWALDRMPTLDLVLLRIGTYELLEVRDTPTGVVISEAVELASEFSTDESSRFVNGVLAAIAGSVRAT